MWYEIVEAKKGANEGAPKGKERMTVEKAIAALKLHQVAQDEVNEALNVLMDEAMRMKKALQFYANKDNYLDGVPMLVNPKTGLMELPDEGAMAREALRLVDVPLGILVAVKEAA